MYKACINKAVYNIDVNIGENENCKICLFIFTVSKQSIIFIKVTIKYKIFPIFIIFKMKRHQVLE